MISKSILEEIIKHDDFKTPLVYADDEETLA